MFKERKENLNMVSISRDAPTTIEIKRYKFIEDSRGVALIILIALINQDFRENYHQSI